MGKKFLKGSGAIKSPGVLSLAEAKAAGINAKLLKRLINYGVCLDEDEGEAAPAAAAPAAAAAAAGASSSSSAAAAAAAAAAGSGSEVSSCAHTYSPCASPLSHTFTTLPQTLSTSLPPPPLQAPPKLPHCT